MSKPSTRRRELSGLDDLDSGSLHVRRWGKGGAVIGTKFRFRTGDMIFGRRRVCQRKLAVAEVDGICLAHAMVARAKLVVALPFLMMRAQKTVAEKPCTATGVQVHEGSSHRPVQPVPNRTGRQPSGEATN